MDQKRYLSNGWWALLAIVELGALGATVGAVIGGATYQSQNDMLDFGRGFDEMLGGIASGFVGIVIAVTAAIVRAWWRWHQAGAAREMRPGS
jgi:hypothetical protein